MKVHGQSRHRIHLAMAKKQNIMIYGDYDVDGTTGPASLVYDYLRTRYDQIALLIFLTG